MTLGALVHAEGIERMDHLTTDTGGNHERVLLLGVLLTFASAEVFRVLVKFEYWGPWRGVLGQIRRDGTQTPTHTHSYTHTPILFFISFYIITDQTLQLNSLMLFDASVDHSTCAEFPTKLCSSTAC